MNYRNQQYTKVLTESVKIQYDKSEKTGFDLVSECIDDDTLTIEDQEGQKEIPIVKRPISQLSVDNVKGASEIAIDSKAKAKPDPDPKKMKSDSKKGTAVGTGK
jgi:hypothetical protein